MKNALFFNEKIRKILFSALLSFSLFEYPLEAMKEKSSSCDYLEEAKDEKRSSRAHRQCLSGESPLKQEHESISSKEATLVGKEYNDSPFSTTLIKSDEEHLVKLETSAPQNMQQGNPRLEPLPLANSQIDVDFFSNPDFGGVLEEETKYIRDALPISQQDQFEEAGKARQESHESSPQLSKNDQQIASLSSKRKKSQQDEEGAQYTSNKKVRSSNSSLPTASFSSSGELQAYSPSLASLLLPQLNSNNSSSSSSSLETQRDINTSSFYFVSSREAHIEALREVVSQAKESLLITSYGVLPPRADDEKIYELLREARQRGVRIYIYSHGRLDLDPKTLDFFYEHGIAYDDCDTHAKILAADDTFVAIGSFSWLSKPTENEWKNVTFCIRDPEVSGSLKDQLWKHLKYHRNLQYGNTKQIRSYESNPYNAAIPVWKLKDKTDLEYLHSLEAHRDLIADLFEEATHRIIIFSPFINEKSGYQEDFNPPLLRKALMKGVNIYFVCRKNDPKVGYFEQYLEKLLHKYPYQLQLILIQDFHHKTIIVDGDLITAGSFNWFSASREIESDFSNHEATLVCRGNEAKPIIKDLLESYPIFEQKEEEKRIDLNVPYSQKDKAKRLGARWDAIKKTWYVPSGLNPQLFAQWL